MGGEAVGKLLRVFAVVLMLLYACNSSFSLELNSDNNSNSSDSNKRSVDDETK